jgi:hypothetical protein
MGIESAAVAALASTAIVTEAAVVTGISATAISQVIVASAVIAGSVAVSMALAPEVPGTETAKASRELISIDGGPRFRIFGRYLCGGSLLLGAADGNDLHRITAHCQGEIDGIEAFYINEVLVATDPSGDVKSRPYNGYVHINTRLGEASQTVFTATQSSFPGDVWSSACRGDGLMMTEVIYQSPGMQAEKHPKVYAAGKPALKVLVRGPAIFDPRLDDGDPENPDTWAWSDNGVLCVLAHLTDDRLTGGWELPFARFDLDDIAEQADLADASVTTRDGTEPRSRCWGVQDLTAPLIDTLSALLISTGTEIVSTQAGLMTIRLVDDAPTATRTLAYDHIDTFDLTGGPESLDRPNKFTLAYLNPDRLYQVSEADVADIAWTTVQDEIDRTGERSHEIRLPFCPSPAQAGRIGRRVAASMRASALIATLNISTLGLMGHSTVEVELGDLDSTIKVALSTVKVSGEFGPSPGAIQGKEVTALSTWDPEEDEPLAPEPILEVVDGNNVPTPEIAETITIARGPRAAPTSYDLWVRVSNAADKSELAWRSLDGRKYSLWRNQGPRDSLPLEYLIEDVEIGGLYDVIVRGVDNDADGFNASVWAPPERIVPVVASVTPGAPSISATYNSGTGLISWVVSSTDDNAAHVRFRIAGVVEFEGNIDPGWTETYTSAGTVGVGVIGDAICWSSSNTASTLTTLAFTPT